MSERDSSTTKTSWLASRASSRPCAPERVCAATYPRCWKTLSKALLIQSSLQAINASGGRSTDNCIEPPLR